MATTELNRDVLSVHKVVATYQGISIDRHQLWRVDGDENRYPPTTLDNFYIESYVSYEKPGKYGDKQKANCRKSFDRSKQPADVVEILQGLKKDDKFTMTWMHEYVTTECEGRTSKFPERVIRSIELTTSPTEKDV